MADSNSGDDTGTGGQPPVDGGATPAAADTPKGAADPRQHAAQLDFELGLPLRTIGAKVGVSEGTIRLWAKAGGWVKPQVGAKRPKAKKVAPAAVSQAADKVVAIRPGVQVKGADYANATQDPGRVAATQPDAPRSETQAQTQGEPEDPSLRQQFMARVQELLVNPTRDEAADVAARAVVQVVMVHRRGVQKLQGIVDRLAGQLDFASDQVIRDLTAQAIEEAYPGPQNAKRRNALLGLIDLRSHAGTAKDLATAMTKLVQLERQAFGLSTNDDPTPPPPPEAIPEARADVFDAIRAKARERIANARVTDVEVKAS